MAISTRLADNRRGGRVGVGLLERQPLNSAGDYRGFDVFDRFIRANDTTLDTAETGETYTYSGSKYGVTSFTAYLSSTTGDANAAAVVDTGHPDAYSRIIVSTPSAGGSFGHTFRYNDSGQRVTVFWQPDDDKVYLYQTTTVGGWEALATSSTGYTPVAGDHLSATIVNNTVTCFRNGKQILSGTTSATLAAFTKHGLTIQATTADERLKDLVIRSI